MDKLKAFITQKKVDAKFKRAGQGKSLAGAAAPAAKAAPSQPQPQPSQPRPANATSSAAAAAAMARVNKAPTPEERAKTRSAQAIKAQAARELAAEKEQKQGPPAAKEPSPGPRRVEVPNQMAALPLLFTCDILGDDVPPMPRAQISDTIEAFLTAQLDEEPVVAAALLILSLNSAAAKAAGIPALAKYVQNILEHPDEPKFRRIKLANKAFQERVAPLKGGRALLEGIGYRERVEDGEPFLVLETVEAEQLAQAKEMLEQGSGVELRVWRDPRILAGAAAEAEAALPDSFFRPSTEEVKAEAERKRAEVDGMLALKTGAMRAKEAEARRSRYKYALIRVRFPDARTLQGTFAAGAPVQELMDFVRSCLGGDVGEWLAFALQAAGGLSFRSQDSGEASLEEVGLCPASKLDFVADAEMVRQLSDAGQPVPYIDAERVEAMRFGIPM